MNSSNTTANEGGYDIRLSVSQWKLLKTNQANAAATKTTTSATTTSIIEEDDEDTKLNLTKDSSGLIMPFLLSIIYIFFQIGSASFSMLSLIFTQSFFANLKIFKVGTTY